MEEMIVTCILFAVALFLFVLSIRSFREKGFLLNNAYLYASKKERAEMNKTPYYRQTAVVLLLMGLVFLLIGFAIHLNAGWVTYIAEAVIAIILIYATVSSIVIEKRKKR